MQKIVGKFFLASFFLSIWMCTFRIWPLALEAAIMQVQGAIKSQKVSLIRLSVFLKNSLINRHTPY